MDVAESAVCHNPFERCSPIAYIVPAVRKRLPGPMNVVFILRPPSPLRAAALESNSGFPISVPLAHPG